MAKWDVDKATCQKCKERSSEAADWRSQSDEVQAAVAAALTEAAEAVEDYCADAPDLAGHGHSVGIRDAILALIREGRE